MADLRRRRHLIYTALAVGITLLALVLRWQGIWYGHPLPLHPDEHQLVERAWRMLWHKELNPEFFIYPSFNIYLQMVLQAVTTLVLKMLQGAQFSEIPMMTFYLVGRAATVVMSAVTIYGVFEVGRRLVHPMAGLVGAVLLAASSLHINNSYYVTVDNPMALWSILAAVPAVLVFTEGPRTRYYLAAGVLAGLAAASKYIAVFAILPVVIAHLSRVGRDTRLIDRNLVLAAVIVPLTLLATSPFLILDQSTFREDLAGISEHYSGGHAGAEAAGDRSWDLYGGAVARGFGLLSLVLAAVGAGWLLVRRASWRALLLVAFPVVLFLLIGSYKVFFARNAVPVLPYLAVLGGIGLVEPLRVLAKRGRVVRSLVTALGVGILVVATAAQVSQAQARIDRLTLPDTRWEAMQWIEAELPAGTCIAREGATPPIETHTDRYQVVFLFYEKVFDRVESDFGDCRPEYLVLSSGNWNRYLRNEDAYAEEAAEYRDFFASHQPVAEFAPEGATVVGPTIRIYRLDG